MYEGYSPYDEGRGAKGKPAETATAVLASKLGYSHIYHPNGTYGVDHYLKKDSYTVQVETARTCYWKPPHQSVRWHDKPSNKLNIPLRKSWLWLNDCLYLAWRDDCKACVFFYPKYVYDAGETYKTNIRGEPFISFPDKFFGYWHEGCNIDPFAPDPPMQTNLFGVAS